MSDSVSRLSREEYERVNAVNWSTLKHLATSPAHYQHALTAQDKDTPAKKMGRVAHLAAFEPDIFRASVAIWTGGRRAGNEWKAFCAENKGRELLTEEEHEQCLSIQRAVRNDPVAKKYLVGGQAEVAVQWAHRLPAGGLPAEDIACKARLDFLGRAAIADLKLTRDASPAAFGRQVWSYCYHAQAAFYVDGALAATGRRLPYVMVAVETREPWIVQVYVVPEEILELGRERYRDLLERLAYCRAENHWPGYADTELSLELPRWAAPKNDDEDVTGLGINFGGEA